MTPKLHKSILLIGATGQIRTASFQQKEHLVVPTVALVEGVIWPMNAEHPELVLFEEFSRGVQGWNGRPVVYGHPILQGQPVSANDPKILEGWCFGTTFNATANAKKKSLEMESWLDLVRAEAVGAQELIDRLRAGQGIEISVGVYTREEEKSGDLNGEKYGAIWREPVPDHLAYLPDGQIGACSNAMGCGAPRVARTHLVTNRGFVSLSRPEPEVIAVAEETKKEEAKPKPKSLWSRIVSRMRAAEGESLTELHQMVWDALYADEPGFMWTEDIWPDENRVIYFVRPEDREITYERKFTVDNGKVTLDAEKTEVKRVSEWKPVAAASEAPPTTASGSCGCGGARHAEQNPNKEENTMTKAERITALMATPKFKVFSRGTLELLTDEQLTSFETEAKAAPVAEAAPAPTTASATTTTVEAVTPQAIADVMSKMSEDDYLKCAPKSIRDLVTNAKSREAAERTTLVAAMKTSQTEFTEEELTAMPLDQLRRFSRICKVDVPADFAGRGVPRTEGGDNDQTKAPKAIDMVARIKASREKSNSATH
jgi:hypothetical protein